ncbi:MAG: hypothetical protein JXR91_13245, partial [Deltaproteobacteria bacterium]|nr:hypothetical protein [Deltaproteobacteria bacterium]
VQFDWKPLDLFNIRVGHYLTPYGIYNEDHGSPVQIDSSVPFIITNNYLPNSQTGIMLFGSAYPADVLGVEYAVTLSNGRGPVSELHDLDENKAVGARLKLKLQFGDFKITAGGYGYYGKYTNKEYTMDVYLDPSANGFDPDIDRPVRASSSVESKYREKIITADLKVEFKGIQLLGEYVGRRVEYITPPGLEYEDTLNLGAGITIPAVQSNYVAQGAYAMLAYTLPLKKFLKQTQITPYFGLDYHSPHDMYKINNSRMMRFGLNVKPLPFVTLKSSVSAIKFKDERFFGGPAWSWTNQVAVSF